jgi:hypothetical protein
LARLHERPTVVGQYEILNVSARVAPCRPLSPPANYLLSTLDALSVRIPFCNGEPYTHKNTPTQNTPAPNSAQNLTGQKQPINNRASKLHLHKTKP